MAIFEDKTLLSNEASEMIRQQASISEQVKTSKRFNTSRLAAETQRVRGLAPGLIPIYFWWWVIKYRGKKNIPKEVIFAQMAKSLERMSQNLQCARASAMNDADTNKDEMREIYDAIKKAENLQQEIENIQKNNN